MRRQLAEFTRQITTCSRRSFSTLAHESRLVIASTPASLVLEADVDRLAAGVREDVEAISAATADDYIQIDIDGKVLDKAATLQRIKSSYADTVDDMVVRI